MAPDCRKTLILFSRGRRGVQGAINDGSGNRAKGTGNRNSGYRAFYSDAGNRTGGSDNSCSLLPVPCSLEKHKKER